MAIELKQTVKLRQQLVITPQLQQAIRLLQLTRLELVDMLSQELKENALLEEVDEAKEFEDEPVTEGTEETPTPSNDHVSEVKGEGEGVKEFDWENYLENYNMVSYQRQTDGDGEERPSFENFLSKRTTLTDHLHWQLQLSRFTETEERVGAWIVGNLDEDGYLKMSLEDIRAGRQAP